MKADRLGQCRQGRLDSLAAPASNRRATLVLVIKYGRAEGWETVGPKHTLGRVVYAVTSSIALN